MNTTENSPFETIISGLVMHDDRHTISIHRNRATGLFMGLIIPKPGMGTDVEPQNMFNIPKDVEEFGLNDFEDLVYGRRPDMTEGLSHALFAACYRAHYEALRYDVYRATNTIVDNY